MGVVEAVSDLISPALKLEGIVKSKRDLFTLERHGYSTLSQIRETDREHFIEWGIKDVDLIMEAAKEARAPKGVK